MLLDILRRIRSEEAPAQKHNGLGGVHCTVITAGSTLLQLHQFQVPHFRMLRQVPSCHGWGRGWGVVEGERGAGERGARSELGLYERHIQFPAHVGTGHAKQKRGRRQDLGSQQGGLELGCGPLICEKERLSFSGARGCRQMSNTASASQAALF